MGQMAPPAMVATDLHGKLQKMASGKVRDLFEVNDERLLFVTSDRISAFDVVMKNVSINHVSSQHMPWPSGMSVVPISGSRPSFTIEGKSFEPFWPSSWLDYQAWGKGALLTELRWEGFPIIQQAGSESVFHTIELPFKSRYLERELRKPSDILRQPLCFGLSSGQHSCTPSHQ